MTENQVIVSIYLGAGKEAKEFFEKLRAIAYERGFVRLSDGEPTGSVGAMIADDVRQKYGEGK